MNGRVKFKRRLKTIACVLLAACLLFCSACGGCGGDYLEYGNGGGEEVADTNSDEKTEVVFDTDGCFSVHFLDVGEGDAIFIDFADGTTMLIDCGEKKESNLKTIENCLDEHVTDGTLNYLVLTHPDSDHVGNAADILTDYKVERAYIPHLLQPENFNAYKDAYALLLEKEIKTEDSETGQIVCGEDYYLVMLSPENYRNKDSAYYKVNFSIDPLPDDINNISPIIYLDYKGVRFIFTGDAGFSQEKVALNNVDTGIVNRYLRNKQKPDVNLTDIDFLKVSHHGSDDASGNDFLQRITPKNAVISVSGNNKYGHPKEETLKHIKAANENCTLYLTCEKGTVSVYVNENGQTMIKTAAAMAA